MGFILKIKKVIYFFVLGLFLFVPIFVFGIENQNTEGLKIQEQTNQIEKTIISELKQNEKIIIDIFVRDTCKHCKEAKLFLTDLQTERSDFEVVYRNLKDEKEYENWKTLAEKKGLPKITPIIFISNTIIQGFDTQETTGKRIIDLIDKGKSLEKVYTFDEFILADINNFAIEGSGNTGCSENSTECSASEVNYIFTLPFFGVVDLYDYSLPTISFVLGFIDGFNPCAMWVLVTFLLVLIQVGNRRRMWEIAGLFIVAEAIMYYLILTVWFTAWDFIGLDAIITPIVGLVAIGGGVFFLYEWKTADGTCKVTDIKERAKISSRIKKLAESKLTWATVLGIIGLALSVNIIEFACSVGIPQAYTKIIEINQLGFWATQGNMLLYIIAYMVDDLIVFGIALYGIDKLHLATKYSKASNLIGGVLMILLGLILIFAREWLVF